jgi:hypothetical protein
VGDKVRFFQRYPFPGRPQEFGFIEEIQANDVFLVRPRWKKDLIQIYSGEIEVVKYAPNTFLPKGWSEELPFYENTKTD